MLCYQYAANKQFTTAKEVKLSPKGELLLPANSTLIPPPALTADWVWHEALNEWQLVPLVYVQLAATIALREAYEAFLAPYRVEYGITEPTGWPKQLEIAKAMLAGTTTAEQVADLEAFCATRELVSPHTPEYLSPIAQAQRIVNNDAAWSAIYFPATGKRNGYQDQINAAQSVEDCPRGPWSFDGPAVNF